MGFKLRNPWFCFSGNWVISRQAKNLICVETKDFHDSDGLIASLEESFLDEKVKESTQFDVF
jgi:hypothetical protein